MKFFLTLALIAPFGASASALTKCDRIVQDQYTNTREDQGLKPTSKLLTHINFWDGYWSGEEGGGVYDKDCAILADRRRILTIHKGKKTSCYIKTLSRQTIKDLIGLRDRAEKTPMRTGFFGICDGPVYSMRFRKKEGPTLTNLETIEDCGDKYRRESRAAFRFRDRIVSLCGLKKTYAEFKEFGEWDVWESPQKDE